MRLAGKVCSDVESDVGALVICTVEASRNMDRPGALLEHAVGCRAIALERATRAAEQFALDVVGKEPRLRLQQQCHRPADYRGRLRCTRHREVRITVVIVRMFARELAICAHQSAHVATRSDKVRLDECLVGRACGRERGQPVVGPVQRRNAVGHCTDGNHVGQVAGHTYGHWCRPVIAGRCHYDDAVLPGSHNCLVQRIIPVIRLRRRAEREVEHADAVCILVFQNPVQPTNDIQVSSLALRIKGFDCDDVRVRSYTIEFAVLVTAADDEARHVTAVSVLVAVEVIRLKLVGHCVVLCNDAPVPT